MFARMIAATFDMRKASKVHPSFVGIIQQLSPLDTQNLMCFCYGEWLPVASVRFAKKEGECECIDELDDCFIHNPKEKHHALLKPSLEVLAVLGLIEKHKKNADNNWSDMDNAFLNYARENTRFCIEDNPLDLTEIFYRGYLRLTNYGRDFCSVCLPPPPPTGEN